MKKYKYIKILLFITCILTSFVSFIHLDTNASADTKKQMMFKDQAISKLRSPATESSYDKLYFGNYSGVPLQWDILNPNENGFGSSNSLLIMTSSLVGSTAYGQMMTRDYASSTLRSYILTTMNNTSHISAKEKDAVIVSQKAAYGPEAGVSDFAINDKFFAPTFMMMQKSAYGFSTGTSANEKRSLGANYWLSAKSFTVTGNAVAVQVDGSISNVHNNFDTRSVRIAANLDSSSIIMMSDATGAQTSQISSSLNENITSLSHEYKLTIKDSTQTLDIPTNIQICNDELTFDYSSSGDAQFLCAAMTDASGQDILSYGKIKDISAEKIGSATIKLPADFFENNYKLQLYTLIDNGNMATDFSSDIVELPVPDPYTITIHYKDADGNDVEKKIWSTDHVDISAYVPKPDDILSDVDGYRLPDNWEWQYDKEGTSFSDVTKEFTASPPYIKTWKVRYLDDLGKMIGDIQIIDDGKNATEPLPPIKELYHFKEWSHSSQNIKSDMDIQATYTPYVYTISTDKDTYAVGTQQIKNLFDGLTEKEIEEKLLQFYHAELYEGNELQGSGQIKVIVDIESLRKGIAGEYIIKFLYVNEKDETFRAEKNFTLTIKEAQGIVPEEPKIPEQSHVNEVGNIKKQNESKNTGIDTKILATESILVQQHMTTEDGISFLKICLIMGISVLGIGCCLIRRKQ